jgi:hypothetical protein
LAGNGGGKERRETRWREGVAGNTVAGRGGGRGVAEMVTEIKIGFAEPDYNESGYSTPI